MIIRPATPADFDQILSFWNPLIRETVITFSSVEQDHASLSSMLAERPIFLVATQSTRVTGLASYKQFRPGNGYAHTMEHTIIVDPDAHRQGTATALMDTIEAHAKSNKAHSMIGAISATNTTAIAFHNSRDYQTAGFIQQAGRKFDQWHDLQFMQKRL